MPNGYQNAMRIFAKTSECLQQEGRLYVIFVDNLIYQLTAT